MREMLGIMEMIPVLRRLPARLWIDAGSVDAAGEAGSLLLSGPERRRTEREAETPDRSTAAAPRCSGNISTISRIPLISIFLACRR
jgi:hypothetical protein